MLTKILKGSSTRKSRLHDHKGNVVPARSMIFNAPRAVVTGLLRITLGLRPERPWISYEAAELLDGFLDSGKAVLEFGSGMSTAWYARRAAKVLSIENFRPWYDMVAKYIADRNLHNVDYRFASNEAEYITVPEGYNGFDLIMVDGSIRDLCAGVALEYLRPGGIIYLDNSDRMAFPDSAEARAGRLILDYARKYNCTVTYFTDFAPTQFFAQEGMLVRRPD